MKAMSEMHDKLNQVQQAYQTGISRQEVEWIMHDLAESRYAPALPFFLSLMDDQDWDWRLEAVRLVGFHYDFSSTSEISEKIRRLLLSDPSPFVRMSAALTLGGRSQWPDKALVESLHQDPDEDVRKAAFEALLALAGMSFPAIRAEMAQLDHINTPVTLKTLETILHRHSIPVEIPSESARD
jgi:hypothetical protein